MALCNICENEGIYLESNIARFCTCPAGQKRKKAWKEYDGRKSHREKDGRAKRDYKARAAGKREPGEDDEIPF